MQADAPASILAMTFVGFIGPPLLFWLGRPILEIITSRTGRATLVALLAVLVGLVSLQTEPHRVCRSPIIVGDAAMSSVFAVT